MLTAKAPPSRNSVSTSRRQTSDRPLTGVRHRFDRYLTVFGIVCVLGSMQGEDNSLAGEDNSLAGEDHLLPRGPRPPPMWGRTSPGGAPNVIISRESEPSLARLSPGFASSRVTVNALDRFVATCHPSR